MILMRREPKPEQTTENEHAPTESKPSGQDIAKRQAFAITSVFLVIAKAEFCDVLPRTLPVAIRGLPPALHRSKASEFPTGTLSPLKA